MPKRMRSYKRYGIPLWLRSCYSWFEPFCLPIACFQAIRTFIFPTFFDALLLAILLCLYFSYFWKKW